MSQSDKGLRQEPPRALVRPKMEAKARMGVREDVTDRILHALMAGTPPWRKGWTSSGLHINASTGKAYRGINQILCAMSSSQSGYEDSRWLTYRQSKEAGYQVRRGEHSTKIVRLVEVDKPKSGAEAEGDVIAEESNRRLVMRVYDVFNAAQIDGMPPLPPRVDVIEPVEAAEAIVEGMKQTGLRVIYGAPSAYYSPFVDTVRMPAKADFDSQADLYGTLLHECAHATGGPTRLNRNIGGPKTATRAREELRAEIASAMACAECGIPLGQYHIDNHAAYVASWVSVLKDDATEIFKAAADAQGICEYMHAHALKQEPNPVQNTESNPCVLAPSPAPRAALPM